MVRGVIQGVNPWIEVDGGVTPKNAYKVIYLLMVSLSTSPVHLLLQIFVYFVFSLLGSFSTDLYKDADFDCIITF